MSESTGVDFSPASSRIPISCAEVEDFGAEKDSGADNESLEGRFSDLSRQ